MYFDPKPNLKPILYKITTSSLEDCAMKFMVSLILDLFLDSNEVRFERISETKS